MIKVFKTISLTLISFVFACAVISSLPVVNYFQLKNSPGLDKKADQEKLVQVALPKKPPPKPKPKPRQNRKQNLKQNLANKLQSGRLSQGLRGAGGRGDLFGLGGGAGPMGDDQARADVDAKLIRQVAPAYPGKAKKYGVRGTVKVLITVGTDGSVVDVEFLETPGDYGFKEVIKEALEKWKYKPAMAGGVPVEQKIEQPFQF